MEKRESTTPNDTSNDVYKLKQKKVTTLSSETAANDPLQSVVNVNVSFLAVASDYVNMLMTVKYVSLKHQW